DRLVTTVCDRCYVGCGIKVHVVNDVVVGMEGDPDNPLNRGRMCAKGKAGVMSHYDPNRLKTPLKRTNPRKGVGVDPQWQEISYEEAIDTIADRLNRIKDDPRKLHIYCWGYNLGLSTFGTAFGTPHIQSAGAHECGKAIHPIEHMAAGGFHQQVDLHYCNYCIYVGTQGAVAARAAFTHIIKDFADARARGMRLVVVDPIGGYAAAKADEWVPIRPGTDAAFGMAFMDVLLNDLGIYDAQFLKKGSNAPYLVAEDGLYLRDTASGKPLVFDTVDGVAKTHDDPTIKDCALEGSYEVRGIHTNPSFELLKKHLAKYPPEWAEGITTVPAATIRRLAKEFGAAVQIGSTMVLEGKEMPFRPAALDWARGPQGHKHGFHQSWALKLINVLMGNVNVPGGILSTGAMGKSPYKWGPEGGVDGMLTHAGWAGLTVRQIPSAFPGRVPSKPERMDILELFPLAGHATTLFPLVGVEPEKYGLDYKIEVAIHSPSNVVLTTYADIKLVEKYYGSIPFVAGFAVELNETNEAYDDIVLPIPSYLEREDAGVASTFDGVYSVLAPVGQDDWYYQIRQKVFEPPPGVRRPFEAALDIAERLGITSDLNRVINQTQRLKGEYRLEPDHKYPMDEINDRMLRSVFGADKGVEWAKEHGVVRYHRDVEEAYPGPFMAANGMRLPIYLEHFPRKGEELQEVIQEMGLSWDFSDYTALPQWLPCDAFEDRKKGEFDLVGVHYKLPFIYGYYANENPWINEICERTPYTYPVLINEDVGRKKGIRDGDAIWLETSVTKVKAVAKLTQCIHPEVLGIAGHFGHWAKGMPISRGKGVAFNPLLPHTLDAIDKISTSLDSCVLIKISKAEG
ncbi:MAG: molybdopterin-dependent oxidoreductase, partial [Dehalococcoidia bacterium]|nr:molybdopterin-dependent oxidoreductase [Dehalococcoidia bacterium]